MIVLLAPFSGAARGEMIAEGGGSIPIDVVNCAGGAASAEAGTLLDSICETAVGPIESESGGVLLEGFLPQLPTPYEQCLELGALVESRPIEDGIKKSYASQVDSVCKSILKEKYGPASNQLLAFGSHVAAQDAKKISPEDAVAMTDAALALDAVLQGLVQ